MGGNDKSYGDSALVNKEDDRKKKQRSTNRKMQERGGNIERNDDLIEIPEQSKLFFSEEDTDGIGGEAKRTKSRYRSDDTEVDDDYKDTHERGNDVFQTPAFKSRGSVKKLVVEPDTPWDWETPQALKEQKISEGSGDSHGLEMEDEDKDDQKGAVDQEMKDAIAEEDRDIFDSVAASTSGINCNDDDIDATIGEIDEAALESSLDRQDSMYNKDSKIGEDVG